MSLTIVVPAAVPSVFHSSRPVAGRIGGEEQRSAGETVSSVGLESADPARMSFTIVVPAWVPSDFQSSTPSVPSVAVK